LATEHYRPKGRPEQLLLGRTDLTELPRGVEVRAHDRQRLLLATLALAQPADRVLVPSVGREVKAAEALHGKDTPFGQQSLGLTDRLLVFGTAASSPIS